MIDRRRALEAWRRLDVTVRDLPLALLPAALSFVPATRSYGTHVGELAARPFDAAAVVAVALECLPLAVRRRWPGVSLFLVSFGFVIDQLGAYHSFSGNAMTIALVSAGAHLERGRRVVVLLLTVEYAVLAVALDRRGSTEGVEGFGTFYLALALAWGIGAWLRSARAAEAERRRRVAVDTRAAERARIARELHDVVTHHVTAMVVQAEAARYLMSAPDRLDHTLTGITDTGRLAIADLRHLLDLLDPGHGTGTGTGTGTGAGARTPSGDSLGALVEQTRRAGQPVELTQEGTPAESGGRALLVVHRVVREALTNALKHAPGSPTRVEVHHRSQEVVVQVRTDGAGVPPGERGADARTPDETGASGARPGQGGQAWRPAVGGSGRGLPGLHARVGVLGGELTAGPADDGGFTVRARIPAGDAS
ncbi:histidine kinase [Myceligenerans cantabricum]